MKSKQLIFSVLITFFLSSCSIFNSNEMFKVPKNYTYSQFRPNEKEYIIQPYDKLDIKIYYNNGAQLIDFNQTAMHQQAIEYQVEFDSLVKLPYLGRIKLAGLTIRKAEQLLENKYKEFIIDPFVSINVINKRVIVFTSGATTGKVLIIKNENYNLIEALAESGGISDFSKSYKIKLIRGNLNNPEVYLFNLRSIEHMKNANFILQANDIIYVEARPRYAAKILSEITPYLSLLSTAILIYTIFK